MILFNIVNIEISFCDFIKINLINIIFENYHQNQYKKLCFV